MNEEKDVKKDEEIVKKAKKVKEVETPVRKGLKSKEDIVKNWLPRYTGRPLEEFGHYILLTNFSKYVGLFSEWNDDAPICVCTCQPLRTSAAATAASNGLSKSPWLLWCVSASARVPRSANSRKCLRSRTPMALVRERSICSPPKEKFTPTNRTTGTCKR